MFDHKCKVRPLHKDMSPELQPHSGLMGSSVEWADNWFCQLRELKGEGNRELRMITMNMIDHAV